MNDEVRSLIEKTSVNAQKIKERREAQEASRKRQEERDKRETESLKKIAVKNGDVFLKFLIFSILDEYERTPEAVANFDNNCYIWQEIPFLQQFDTRYNGKDKTLCEIYNSSLDEEHSSEMIYYYELTNSKNKAFVPIRINLQKLLNIGIFAEIQVIERKLKIKVDMHKLRILTVKARNGELNGSPYDEETIKRLKDAYDNVRALEDALSKFIISIHNNSDVAYLDIFKSLLSAYKSTPNKEELKVRSNLVASDPSSPYERMVKLFKDSKIDPEDYVVYYPIKVNSRSKNKTNLVPVLLSDVMKKIQEDLPQSTFSVSVSGSEVSDHMETKVNTHEFEELLISIQNPEKQTKKSM